MHIPAHLTVENLVALSALLTLIAPYLAAIFTQDHFPQWANELIAGLVSIGMGVVSFTAAGGSFNAHDSHALELTIASVFTGAKVYYSKLLPNSPLIKAIEYITGGAKNGASIPAALLPASVSELQIEALPTQATDVDADGSGG